MAHRPGAMMAHPMFFLPWTPLIRKRWRNIEAPRRRPGLSAAAAAPGRGNAIGAGAIGEQRPQAPGPRAGWWVGDGPISHGPDSLGIRPAEPLSPRPLPTSVGRHVGPVSHHHGVITPPAPSDTASGRPLGLGFHHDRSEPRPFRCARRGCRITATLRSMRRVFLTGGLRG
jgi:hypothetical protein